MSLVESAISYAARPRLLDLFCGFYAIMGLWLLRYANIVVKNSRRGEELESFAPHLVQIGPCGHQKRYASVESVVETSLCGVQQMPTDNTALVSVLKPTMQSGFGLGKYHIQICLRPIGLTNLQKIPPMIALGHVINDWLFFHCWEASALYVMLLTQTGYMWILSLVVGAYPIGTQGIINMYRNTKSYSGFSAPITITS